MNEHFQTQIESVAAATVAALEEKVALALQPQQTDPGRLRALQDRLFALLDNEARGFNANWFFFFSMINGFVFGLWGFAENMPTLSIFGAIIAISASIALGVSTVNNWLRTMYKLLLEEAIERKRRMDE